MILILLMIGLAEPDRLPEGIRSMIKIRSRSAEGQSAGGTGAAEIRACSSLNHHCARFFYRKTFPQNVCRYRHKLLSSR
jgi:hypothetical protein